MEEIRDEQRIREEKFISEIPFPPKFLDDNEVEKTCLRNFIKATCRESIATVECGICGESVMKRDIDGNKNIILNSEIPGRNLLLLENQDNPDDFLEEYKHDDILLSEGGVNGALVTCCNTCLSSLKNEKLPKFSIANDFQIGKTPPELADLTLSEKLLISKCRPKMYVVKLRSSCGPEAQQRGLKGNTITFPQDTLK